MDRTAEFKAAVTSLASRGHIKPSTYRNGNRRGQDAATFTDFSRLATSISKEIRAVNTKLDTLSKLVSRKAMFDDRPVEISETTHSIKQDISKLSMQVSALQQHVRATAAKSTRATKQLDDHCAAIVSILQTKLSAASMSFKEALEIRSASMQAAKQRQDQLLQAQQSQANTQSQRTQSSAASLFSTISSSVLSNGRTLTTPPPPSSSSGTSLQPPSLATRTRSPQAPSHVSPFLTPRNATPSNNHYLSNNSSTNGGHLSNIPPQGGMTHQQQQRQSISIPGEDPTAYSMHRRKANKSGGNDGYYEDDTDNSGPASMLFQQQQYAPQADQYAEGRATAMEAVESTLQELGGIFQQMAQMVAEQANSVQRIEANSEDIEMNINEAQNQLLRYYRNISSDRGMMIKIFITVIFVFLVMTVLS